MKLVLVKAGKIQLAGIDDLVSMYHKRSRAWCDIETHEVRANSQAQETEKFRRITSTTTLTVLLDERGKTMKSAAWAKKLSGWRDDGRIKSVALIVGSPYGFAPEFRATASELISFSPMTFPSDLAWLLLWEQTYRGLSIIHGSDYHHGD